MASSVLCGQHQTIATDFVNFIDFNFIENLASILELDEGLNMHFNIYSDAPENERTKEVESSLFGGDGGKADDKYFI
jgi:hypothetical protein